MRAVFGLSVKLSLAGLLLRAGAGDTKFSEHAWAAGGMHLVNREILVLASHMTDRFLAKQT